ncbi:MAG: zinc-dependent metalloprotease, partial [Saprospiraceae bacterium]
MQEYNGYFDFFYDEKEGKIYLAVEDLDNEFLYVNSLPAGIGSNDIGLDRNQLGGNRIVKFIRSGNKILLVQPNYDYRAVSDNYDEQKSVEEAFAQSVLWGFTIKEEQKGRVLIDLTPFLMHDAHGVAQRLQQAKQGSYSVDASRSALYLERTKSFPKNSEFEATITFKGKATGNYIRSVTPSSDAVTVRQHHSFIELPDDNYEPRHFDPRSGFFGISYQDYATPISQPLTKRFINRHRLEKKDPTQAVSEAVEPIVYYLDRGTPEPIRSALIEGASWWNQAFEAAGYKNAFQVKVLPAEADPMDVRYNVINWVHRSTRGWSYGSSVSDPRTGEIIKGHVLLGSLRVRQDFLIAQGLVEAYENGTTPDPRLEEMALARLRQLSAHEVGHTIGLAHNFAASYNDRSSVMDYPHPYVRMNDSGKADFGAAYDDKIGDWDKRTILYGYQDFPDNVDVNEELQDIINQNIQMGFRYISDRDARPASGAHPYGHLWDNGASPAQEMRRMIEFRAKALENFSEKNIPVGAPMATLENVLVPIYLMHRYQVEAVAKSIGGVEYTYAMRGDGQPTNAMLPAKVQREALNTLLETLKPEFLAIPEKVIQLIPPQPMGYQRDRELFKINTGLTFDPLSAAESSANKTLTFLLNPARLTRLVEQ